jgi:5-methyltetrahydropteroyltriglutamate--homocysteine methyltransferase
MLGAIDVATETFETPEEVVEVLRRALEFVDADKLIPSTDCGMAPLLAITDTRESGPGR